MTYVQYPYAQLVKLATNLHNVKSQLSDGKRGAEDCDGLGSTDDQSTVQDAINDFRGEWKTSVSQLIDDVGTWGDLSGSIGSMVEQFDEGTAKMFQVPGQSGAAPNAAP